MNDPVTKWLDFLALPRAVTLCQLLRHTSGIPDYGTLPRYHDSVRTSPQSPWTDDEFLAATLAQGLLFEPGTGWAYSNVGYLLLRRVIERVSGYSFADCVWEQIVTPLRLRNTFVAKTIDDWATCIPGYGCEVQTVRTPVDIRPIYHPGWCAPGVAVSTVDDITLFFDALLANRWLTMVASPRCCNSSAYQASIRRPGLRVTAWESWPTQMVLSDRATGMEAEALGTACLHPLRPSQGVGD